MPATHATGNGTPHIIITEATPNDDEVHFDLPRSRSIACTRLVWIILQSTHLWRGVGTSQQYPHVVHRRRPLPPWWCGARVFNA
eukprot:scaffold224_cov181-Alexandrium_tamarense.AAC.18